MAVVNGVVHNITYLYAAVAGNDTKLANILVQGGAEVKAHQLTLAAYMGNLDMVKLFVQVAQMDVNAQDSKLSSALDQAALKNHLAMAIYLLDHGADLHLENGQGLTPLMTAVASNNLDMARLLVHRGAEAVPQHALILAVQGGHVDMVQYLVEELHLDVDSLDSRQQSSALHYAAGTNQGANCTKFKISQISQKDRYSVRLVRCVRCVRFLLWCDICETCEMCEICEICETCETCETCEMCKMCEICEICEMCENFHFAFSGSGG